MQTSTQTARIERLDTPIHQLLLGRDDVEIPHILTGMSTYAQQANRKIWHHSDTFIPHLSHVRLRLPEEHTIKQLLEHFGPYAETCLTEHKGKPIGWARLRMPLITGSKASLPHIISTPLAYLEITLGQPTFNGMACIDRAVYQWDGPDAEIVQLGDGIGDIRLQQHHANAILATANWH